MLLNERGAAAGTRGSRRYCQDIRAAAPSRKPPRALAQFFEKIEAETKGKQPAQFFSDHPNPGNRIGRIDEEVDRLGGPEPDYRSDSDDFRSIKIYVMKLPKPPKRATRK